MKVLVLAIGKLRGDESAWCDEYLKRLGQDISVKEMAAPKSLSGAEAQKAEAALILQAIPPQSHVVLMDERGKDCTSRDFAGLLERWHMEARQVVFIIGGADGVTDDVRRKAQTTLCFGHATWPHRLVRVMLLEQIYRARQITAGHPYHRD